MVVTGDTAGCVESVWNSTIRHISATPLPPIKVIFQRVSNIHPTQQGQGDGFSLSGRPRFRHPATQAPFLIIPLWPIHELPQRWSDHLVQLALETDEDVPDLAAQWIVRATAHILHVHYTCHLTNRKFWPKSIPTWPHGDDGLSLYKEEVKHNISPANRRKS